VLGASFLLLISSVGSYKRTKSQNLVKCGFDGADGTGCVLNKSVKMKQETRSIVFRFAVVGTIVAACYVIFYLTLLALGLSQPLANIIAFLSAVTIQYMGQALWTFRRPLAIPTQIGRFLGTIGLGLVVSALITGVLGPSFGWESWVSAVLVTLVLPVQNFIFFRIWVFTETKTSSER
jgi:putative flippase GtrA